jgi:tripartite-type tricarboxylate transporter receptor subunit TctC
MAARRGSVTTRQRRRCIPLLLGAGLCALSLHAVGAQPHTSRPLRVLVPAPAGSSIDVLARVLAERMKDVLARAVVVENLPGAGGTIAIAAVARAEPDGRTLAIGFNGPLAFAPYLYSRLPYDPQRDLQPIVLATSQPNVLVVAAALPAASVPALIAHARSRSGALRYASVGNGSSSHLSMELFRALAGVELVHVPYNGSPPALNAIASGDAQLAFVVPTAATGLAQAGKLRMLAVSSAERWPLMPQLPTIAEAGLAGFEALAWNGFVGPAGMASEQVDALNESLDRLLHEPAVRARLHAAGLAPVGGTAQAFAAWIRAEAQKWAPIIRRTGARLD